MFPASKHFVSPRTAVTGLLSFVLIGAAQALYGPALPGFTKAFGLQAGTAGLAVSVHNMGALLGVLSAIPLADHSAARWRVGASVSLLAVGTLLVGIAPSWSMTLVGVLLIGIGYGALTIGMNSLYAVGFGKRSPAMVNLLNAIFGVGAILSPLLVLLNPTRPHFSFLILAGVSALLIPLSFMMDDRVPPAPVASERRRNRGLLFAFILLLALGVGVEASTVGYAATYLIAVGVTPAGAATVTSLFFLAFTLSRLVAIWLSLRFTPPQLVLGCLSLAALLLFASHNGALAPFAITLLGGAIAIFFPNCFNWLNRVLGTSGGTVLVLAGALMGGMMVPTFIAWVAASLGERYIISALLGLNLITLLTGSLLLLQLPTIAVTQSKITIFC